MNRSFHDALLKAERVTVDGLARRAAIGRNLQRQQFFSNPIFGHLDLHGMLAAVAYVQMLGHQIATVPLGDGGKATSG